VLRFESCRLLWLPCPTPPQNSKPVDEPQAISEEQSVQQPLMDSLASASEELEVLPEVDFEEAAVEKSPACEQGPAAEQQQHAAAEESAAKLLAQGALELTAIPAPPSLDDEELKKPSVVLTIGEGTNLFCTLCLPGMNVCIFDDFLTFPAAEDAGIAAGGRSGGICGLIADEGVETLRIIATQLGEFGCRLHWQPRPGARAAAQAIGFAGGAVAGGIDLAVGAVGGGFKAASKALRKSGMIESKEQEVPKIVREGAAVARAGTLMASQVAGKFAHGIAWGAGWAAGKVHEKATKEFHARDFKSKQWHQDVKVLASASMEAGAGIFSSFAWSTYKVAGQVADAGCDLVGHRYGEEAGVVARDGIHCVGNALTVQALIAPPVIAKLVAAKVGTEVAGKLVPSSTSSQSADAAEACDVQAGTAASVQISNETK